MSEAIEKFEIAIGDEVLEDLHRRLAASRFPDQIPDTGWDYGTELGYLKELVGYWLEKFDWRAQEAALNRFDHFRGRSRGPARTTPTAGR